MDHGIPAETRIRSDLLDLARYAGVRPVATNDCHYAPRRSRPAHDLWLCVGQQDTMVSDPDRWRFTGTGYHMRPAQEMYRLFSGAEQACDNTLLIADMVDDRVLPEPRQRLPRFDVPAGFADAPAYLRQLVADGAARRYGTRMPAAVRARLNLEFRTIRQLGFADYFLIVHDVVTAARAHGILVGPGRGSAAGSLVLFCLGVVAVDPLANGLLFERFLDPDRTDMPDVDLDFDSDGQAWVFSYLTRRWGADRVARLGTFGYARGRQAIKDAARVLLPPERRAAVGNALAARVPTATTPLAVLLDPDNPDGAALRGKAAETPDHRRVLDAARQIDGKVRSEGVHACGVVIATEPLDAVVPLRRDRREGRDDTWVTQWDGADITALGHAETRRAGDQEPGHGQTRGAAHRGPHRRTRRPGEPAHRPRRPAGEGHLGTDQDRPHRRAVPARLARDDRTRPADRAGEPQRPVRAGRPVPAGTARARRCTNGSPGAATAANRSTTASSPTTPPNRPCSRRCSARPSGPSSTRNR